jgi:streptogrisin C
MIARHMRRLVAGAGTIALVALLFGVAGAAPAAADTPAAFDRGAGGDPKEAAAAAYLSVYPKMSLAAARAAAGQQDARKAFYTEIAAKQPDAFGGAWFDPPSGVFHFAVTTKDVEARATELGKQLGIRVQTHRVARSFAELEKQAAALRAGESALGKAAGGQVGIDVTTNSVTVALPEQRLATFDRNLVPAGVALVRDPGLHSSEDVCTARDNCNDSLRSGLVISTSGAGCSLGFTARSSSGTRWALTAGHCNSGGTETWSTAGTTIGSLNPANAINSGAVDASAIQVTNATYAADTVGRIYISGTSWSGVDGSAPTLSYIWSGDTVCLSARYQAPGTVGNPCAVVTSNSDAGNRGLARVDGYDGCHGDSGGGWYWLTSAGSRIAYGLHSRSGEDGCNVGSVSWFSALPTFWTGLTYDIG